MNTLELAQTAYAAPGIPTRTARGAEYEVIARITRRLRAADKQRREAFPAFAEALHDNVRLWTALASDVAEPGNALPDDLRARIIYLYEFTMHHSQAVLGEGAPVDVLVDINTAVLRGLRGGSEAA